MLDKKYYEGYEGEGEIRIWSNKSDNEEGMIIWIGYFNTILEGCFNSEFQKNGIIECYFNHNGFYDDKWEMRNPYIVLEELKMFDETLLSTKEEKIIKKTKEIIELLVIFINTSIKKNRNIYVECD